MATLKKEIKFPEVVSEKITSQKIVFPRIFMPPTKKMRVQIKARGLMPLSLRYDVDLDDRWSAATWQRQYLEEGFRLPDTGRVIQPEDIEKISVEEIGNEMPVHNSLAWLYEQVNETCSYALH